jgi:hypothetical protein
MIVKVYPSISWYIPLYTCDYKVQQMEVRAANLYSGSMEAPFGHIKWIASGPPYASEKLRLPFHTSEGSQGAIHNMGLQEMIELGRSLACACRCLLVRLVWSPSRLRSQTSFPKRMLPLRVNRKPKPSMRTMTKKCRLMLVHGTLCLAMVIKEMRSIVLWCIAIYGLNYHKNVTLDAIKEMVLALCAANRWVSCPESAKKHNIAFTDVATRVKAAAGMFCYMLSLKNRIN